MIFRKLFTIFALFIIASIAIIWAKNFLQSRAEFSSLTTKNVQLSEQIRTKSKQIEEKKNYIVKILTDPEFRERLVREKLGYIKNNEFIVRFFNQKEEISTSNNAGHKKLNKSSNKSRDGSQR